MIVETDLERLERQVQKARTLVHESAIKVEELVASVHAAEEFKVKIKQMGKPPLRATAPTDPKTPNSD